MDNKDAYIKHLENTIGRHCFIERLLRKPVRMRFALLYSKSMTGVFIMIVLVNKQINRCKPSCLSIKPAHQNRPSSLPIKQNHQNARPSKTLMTRKTGSFFV